MPDTSAPDRLTVTADRTNHPRGGTVPRHRRALPAVLAVLALLAATAGLSAPALVDHGPVVAVTAA